MCAHSSLLYDKYIFCLFSFYKYTGVFSVGFSVKKRAIYTHLKPKENGHGITTGTWCFLNFSFFFPSVSVLYCFALYIENYIMWPQQCNFGFSVWFPSFHGRCQTVSEFIFIPTGRSPAKRFL